MTESHAGAFLAFHGSSGRALPGGRSPVRWKKRATRPGAGNTSPEVSPSFSRRGIAARASFYQTRLAAAPMTRSVRGRSEAEVNVGCGAAASRERN